jgi:hypothetical protein
MFAEYRVPDPLAPRRKATEQRIALAWLALSNGAGLAGTTAGLNSPS